MSLNIMKYSNNNRHIEPHHHDRRNFIARTAQCSPRQKRVMTMPKFNRILSSSQLGLLHSRNKQRNKEPHNNSNLILYNKLTHQLDEIKETLKQSFRPVGRQWQKHPGKRKERVYTQFRDHNNPPEKEKDKKYYDVLEQIASVRSRNRKNNLAESDPNMPSMPGPQERTLFYGIQFIDGMEFKIKLKLTKTHYYLFAKNSQIKIMVEIGYAEYMKLHIAQFRGNPCNILKHLSIEDDKIKLQLEGPSGRKAAPSLKSYVSYY